MSSVQDIFLQFYSRYRENYTPHAQQAKAAKDIMRCRTAALGGHVYECKECPACKKGSLQEVCILSPGASP